MIPVIDEQLGELKQLCVRHRELRLDLFGSAHPGNRRRCESGLHLFSAQQAEAAKLDDAIAENLKALGFGEHGS